MNTMLSLSDIDIAGQRVLIREDFNVPLDEAGQISNDERIRRALPTLQYAIQHRAQVILLSHLGRPTEGIFETRLSLQPVAQRLSELLQQPVRLIADWQTPFEVEPGHVVLLENVRFNPGEKKNAPELAKQYAQLCEVFVMDAFATAHRKEASTCGVAEFAPIACAGPLLVEELRALTNALDQPQRPLVAVIGGAKVSSKIDILRALIHKVDALIVGGGMANTFLAAAGQPVGGSLYEADWVETGKQLMQEAKSLGVNWPLPVDVVVADALDEFAKPTLKHTSAVNPHEKIFDIGPQTIQTYCQILKSAKTIVWNGPMGVFEYPAFEQGTRAVGTCIAESEAFSIAGGGDTLAALAKFGIMDAFSYVSTGGGAFLEWLEGRALPGVEILKQKVRP